MKMTIQMKITEAFTLLGHSEKWKVRGKEIMAHILFKATSIIFFKKEDFFTRNLMAAFIIGFQVLLFTCAGLLIQENSALANNVALYAYCLLILGIILQAISSIKVEGVKKR